MAVFLTGLSAHTPRAPIHPGRPTQVIDIKHVDALADEDVPYVVSNSDGPGREVPVADLEAAPVSASNMAADLFELLMREAAAPHLADGLAEGSRRVVRVRSVVRCPAFSGHGRRRVCGE